MSFFIYLLLSACLNPTRFDEQWSEEQCLLLSECEALDLYGYSSESECLAQTDPVADECDAFDRETAADCLKAMEQMGCKALLKDRFPSACSQVCAAEE